MTINELDVVLTGLGYTSTEHDGHSLYYVRGQYLQGPKCTLNGRPPEVHVHVWPDIRQRGYTFEGSVEFEIGGERQGLWAKISLYPVKRHEVTKELLAQIEQQLEAMWCAYCSSEAVSSPPGETL